MVFTIGSAVCQKLCSIIVPALVVICMAKPSQPDSPFMGDGHRHRTVLGHCMLWWGLPG